MRQVLLLLLLLFSYVKKQTRESPAKGLTVRKRQLQPWNMVGFQSHCIRWPLGDPPVQGPLGPIWQGDLLQATLNSLRSHKASHFPLSPFPPSTLQPPSSLVVSSLLSVSCAPPQPPVPQPGGWLPGGRRAGDRKRKTETWRMRAVEGS